MCLMRPGRTMALDPARSVRIAGQDRWHFEGWRFPMKHMRRPTRGIVAMALLGLIAFVGIVTPFAGAQQASPPPTTDGVSGGGLGSGMPDVAPGHLLSLRRGVFEPNGYVSLHHHPGALVLWIESGELIYAVSSGAAQLTRATTEGTPAATEQLGPGTQTTLRPGDAVFEQSVVHVSRNDGSEPVVLWIAALAAADQPLTVFESATPTS